MTTYTPEKIAELEATAITTAAYVMLKNCKQYYFTVIPLFKLQGYRSHKLCHLVNTYNVIALTSLNTSEEQDLIAATKQIIKDCVDKEIGEKTNDFT